MKWERKVHKIGLLRRFMRIAWTLNSSHRRYLRYLCPPWPVLHHLQPYDGTCSPQFSECQVGQNWSLCKYLTIFSSHGCGNLGQVGMDGCYNSVYFEEASIAVEFRCFRFFALSFIARCRQIGKHTLTFQIAINWWLSYSFNFICKANASKKVNTWARTQHWKIPQ